MSKWAGKYVIGLTGNIATGKSVVRRMLEHLGAYGIDADALSHRAIARGAPGYQPTIEMFGRWILSTDLQIDRARLGKVVFSDPQALALLEKIVHPLVRQAIDIMVRRASQRVIVIEAIKLLEGGLSTLCDSTWVIATPPETQLARLMKNRGMSEADARRRITAQPPQQDKIGRADVVIKGSATIEEVWKQVQAGWVKHVPQGQIQPEAPAQTVSIPQGELSVMRARPKNSAEIAALFNRLGGPREHPLRADDVMATFGDKAFLLLRMGNTLSGLIGWQVENLVARTTDILLDPALPFDQVIPPLVTEMERASRDLQCEASLVFVPQALLRQASLWQGLGYEPRALQALTVQAWQEAAQESMPPGTSLYFKQLRQDRILRPI